MGLWYNKKVTSNRTGKFRPVRRAGVERGVGHAYRGWSYHLVRHRSGTTIHRHVYHVTVSDPLGNRIAYLTDFRSAALAGAAARKWIDEALAKTERSGSAPGGASQTAATTLVTES